MEWGPAGNRRLCTLEAGHSAVRNLYGHWCPDAKTGRCVACGMMEAFCSCSVWDTLYKGVSPEVLADAKRQHADKLAAEKRCERLERSLYEERGKRKGLLKQIRELVKEAVDD